MSTIDPQDHVVIHVQFVDVAGKIRFKPFDLPAEKLPESFEAQTTMHLGEADWSVLEAIPTTAAEFRRTGQLVLKVVKVEKGVFAATDQILFSLATLSNELPSISPGSSKLQKNTLELHEDDWRQIEWISAFQLPFIKLELNSIVEIYEKQRVSGGFKEVHVRKRIPTPLADTRIPLLSLLAALGPRAEILDGISLEKIAGTVADGFAARLATLGVYGTASSGHVETVAFHNCRFNRLPEEDIQALADFAAKNDLLLVDWCRAQMVPADAASYHDFCKS